MAKGASVTFLEKGQNLKENLPKKLQNKAQTHQIFSPSSQSLMWPADPRVTVPGEEVPAVQFQVTFCSPGAPDCSVPSRLEIHLSLGRNHSFRSQCADPRPGRTTSALSVPARGGPSRVPGALGPGRRAEVSLSPPRAHRPGWGVPALRDLAHLGRGKCQAEPLSAPGAAAEGPGLCSRSVAPAPRARRAPATPPAAFGAKAPARRSRSRRPPRSLRGPDAGEGPSALPSPPGAPGAAAAHPGEPPVPAEPRQLWAISPRSAWCRRVRGEPRPPAPRASRRDCHMPAPLSFLSKPTRGQFWSLSNRGAAEDQERAPDSLPTSALPGLVPVAPNRTNSRDGGVPTRTW